MFPYSLTVSEIAPAVRRTPAESGQRMGEPEKPKPIPVASTAGPEARTRILGVSEEASPATTSITSTLKDEIAVPRTTDRPVQRIPERTSDSGMIGGAAAAGAARAKKATARSDVYEACTRLHVGRFCQRVEPL